MRSAVIGGYFHDRPEALRHFVLASTQLTHTDPKAAVGAEAVARLAAWAVEHEPTEPPDASTIVAMLVGLGPDDREWRQDRADSKRPLRPELPWRISPRPSG